MPEDQIDPMKRRLALIGAVSRQITSILNRDTLLDTVVASIRDMLDYPVVHLFLVDAATGDLAFRPAPSRRDPL